MEYRQIARKVIDFQKLSFETWFSTVSLLQDQTVSTFDMIVRADWFPSDERHMFKRWAGIAHDERKRFKSCVDLGFTALTASLSEPRKPQQDEGRLPVKKPDQSPERKASPPPAKTKTKTTKEESRHEPKTNRQTND